MLYHSAIFVQVLYFTKYIQRKPIILSLENDVIKTRTMLQMETLRFLDSFTFQGLRVLPKIVGIIVYQ